MWAEGDGTYTNFEGRVQRASKCSNRLDSRSPSGKSGRNWDAGSAWRLPSVTSREVFDQIGEHVASFKGLTWEGLGDAGRMLSGLPEPPYRKVQSSHPLPAY